MKKYNTRPIDFTGCHPVIAEAMKRGEAIKCRVWDDGHPGEEVRYVVSYWHKIYVSEGIVEWDHAEPIPRKDRRIMPPERAIPKLIEDGYGFGDEGHLVGPGPTVIPSMFAHFGKLLTSKGCDCYTWPPCIVEEVEDDE